MNRIDAEGLGSLKKRCWAAPRHRYAEVGISEKELSWYADFRAEGAGLAYAQKFDLRRPTRSG
jgi:hypothetical protein